MWAVYLIALLIGLGILLAQIVIGSGDGHGGHGGGSHGHGEAIADDAVALFLSSRFWIFFALAFGLSGSLLTFFALAPNLSVALIASVAGVVSGLFAALAFRAARRLAVTTSASASEAIGSTGRVLIPCAKGKVGQVRIALKGQTVDLMATTDEDEIARGDEVLIEDMRGEVAHVSPRPHELA
jgi:membrane protein implicated in regulation of membrane protease activity